MTRKEPLLSVRPAYLARSTLAHVRLCRVAGCIRYPFRVDVSLARAIGALLLALARTSLTCAIFVWRTARIVVLSVVTPAAVSIPLGSSPALVLALTHLRHSTASLCHSLPRSRDCTMNLLLFRTRAGTLSLSRP